MRIRRLIPLLLFAVCFLPSSVEAQPSFMAGGGYTSPLGDFGNSADGGLHLKLGLALGIPTLPVSLQADGAVHNLSAADPALEDVDMLNGSVSLVYRLPGVGLVPYLLAGIGTYRIESGPEGDEQTDTNAGYHGGFGVNVGAAAGIRAFAELRYVSIRSDPDASAFVPLTVGLRF